MNYKLHKDNTIVIHDEKCFGCESTKSDYMLSLGGTDPIQVLGGNNEPTAERRCVLDIFISKDQVFQLYKQIKKELE